MMSVIEWHVLNFRKAGKRGENVLVWEIKLDVGSTHQAPRSDEELEEISFSNKGIRFAPFSLTPPRKFRDSRFCIVLMGKWTEASQRGNMSCRLSIEDDQRRDCALVSVENMTIKEDSNRWNAVCGDIFSPSLSCLLLRDFFLTAAFGDGEPISISSIALKGGPESISNMAINKGLTSLSEDMIGLLEKDDGHDLTLKVKDAKFKAHRVIVKARSPVFRRMFEHDTAEKRSGEVEVTDSDPDVFAKFLRFLYSGDVSITSPDVADLYSIADKYGVLELAKNCAAFMASEFSIGSFCDYVSLAALHNEEAVLDAGVRFMAEHLQEIVDSEKWKAFNTSSPEQSTEILSKALRVKSNK